MAPTIKHLAAPDCVLLLWAVWTRLPDAIELIEACGFEYKTNGFLWLKTTPNAEVIKLDGKGLHYGNSLSGTCANTEPVLLGTRGSPQRLSKDVHQVIIAPVGAHSAKPDEAYRRMERLYAGPRLELFARKPREGWITWGNENSALRIPGGGRMSTLFSPLGRKSPGPTCWSDQRGFFSGRGTCSNARTMPEHRCSTERCVPCRCTTPWPRAEGVVEDLRRHLRP